jgi:cellulose synthase (UDP-forming)
MSKLVTQTKYILSRNSILLIKTVFIIQILLWSNILIQNFISLQVDILHIIHFIVLCIVCFWYILCLCIDLFLPKFDLNNHNQIVEEYIDEEANTLPTVDIFLPICGEPTGVLRNTWEGVKSINYQNKKVYVLDDRPSKEVSLLAMEFGFNYIVRPNLGEMKKAGNLKFAYENTDGEYIIIFDADFRPTPEFINNTLAYLLQDKQLAIVQTPQAFITHREDNQPVNLLEYGAGNIQEFFYKVVQPARNVLGGAICVGTNAIYRRSALDEIGGTAQIEHSEDVWTGFKLKSKGWKLHYLPLILALGRCPDNPVSHFKQQTRWCQGSMSLMTSSDFWLSPIRWSAKICYISGFLYYISNLCVLVLPISTMLVVLQNNQAFSQTSDASIVTLILRAVLLCVTLMIVVFPKANLGTIVALANAGWAYSYTLINLCLGRKEQWVATGAVKKVKSYNITRTVHLLYTLLYLYLLFISFHKFSLDNTVLAWLVINLGINIIMLIYYWKK